MSDPLGFSSTKCRPAPSWSSTTEAVNLLHAMPFAWLRAQVSLVVAFARLSRDHPENAVHGGAAITNKGFLSRTNW
eukprot:4619851-Amphidinium_carterae.1